MVDGDTLLNVVAKTVKSRRIASGLSQEVLARKAGVSVKTVARLEQGQGVQLHAFLCVASALGMKIT